MRTTIEITDEQRSELLRIASRRGEKGFSSVVRDAIDLYVRQNSHRQEAVRAALGVRGSLSTKEADELDARVRSVRESWR